MLKSNLYPLNYVCHKPDGMLKATYCLGIGFRHALCNYMTRDSNNIWQLHRWCTAEAMVPSRGLSFYHCMTSWIFHCYEAEILKQIAASQPLQISYWLWCNLVGESLQFKENNSHNGDLYPMLQPDGAALRSVDQTFGIPHRGAFDVVAHLSSKVLSSSSSGDINIIIHLFIFQTCIDFMQKSPKKGSDLSQHCLKSKNV